MAKNMIILEGTIIGEPRLRSTKTGVEVANLTLLVEDGDPSNTYHIIITKWGKHAIDYATQYSKGTKVVVNGKLLLRTRLINKDGSEEDPFQFKEMEIRAENVYPLA